MSLALGLMGLVRADSEKAQADLLMESITYQAGKPFHASIRITYKKGWHGYWINPGEGGMKTVISWVLPQGWKAGDPGFPAPVREVTGGLVTYGYVGEVLLPVVLQPPKGAAGPAVLEVKVKWLACNDDGCVPGEALLRATVADGPPADGPQAALVRNSRDVVPARHPGLFLAVAESGKSVDLVIFGESLPDLDGAEVFPVTEQALSPAAAILLSKRGNSYRAKAEKSEYAAGPLKHLSVVIRKKNLPRPVAVEWKMP